MGSGTPVKKGKFWCKENWSWYIAGDDFIRCGRCINELWRANTAFGNGALIIIKTRCRIAEALLMAPAGLQITFTYTNPDDGNNNALRQSSLNSWNWGLCLNDATSIREKMVAILVSLYTREFWRCTRTGKKFSNHL